MRCVDIHGDKFAMESFLSSFCTHLRNAYDASIQKTFESLCKILLVLQAVRHCWGFLAGSSSGVN